MSVRFLTPSKFLLFCLIIGCGYFVSDGQTRSSRSDRTRNASETTTVVTPKGEVKITGQRIILPTGVTLEVDEVARQGEEIWYKVGNVWRMLNGPVKSVEPILTAAAPPAVTAVAAPKDSEPKPPPSYWIHLVGGARVKADTVTEDSSGAWYQRGNLSVFLERARIARIEMEADAPKGGRWKADGWSSGNALIDSLIKANGERFGVDPYLIFCVIEHESHFRTRAVSPKGAQGLMQLMPGTARRFGVRRPHDPAENIFGGTQYLKELLTMFGGQIHLALASYNAGEGAVMRYGRNIPPYRETREYVKRITKRYGAGSTPEP